MIVEFLKNTYPSIVFELDVIGIFYRDYKDKQIKEALAYLVDKGYAERIERHHPLYKFEKQIFYRLTAKGVDLYEGTIEDDGILIEGH